MSADFTELGLALCALAFAALAVSLRPGLVSSAMPRVGLRLASLFMVFWSVAALLLARRGMLDTALELLLSLSLVVVWMWQLYPFARRQGLPSVLRAGLLWPAVAVLGGTLLWMHLSARRADIPAPTLGTIALTGVALATFGLCVVEQLYRNAAPESRPAMRWLGLGMGGMLLAQLVWFAQTLLLGTTTATPDAIRSVVYALCAIALMRGAHLMPQWEMGLSVSRHVVFYASTFVLVGAYLVLMALAGWLILRFAGGWTLVAELVFAALAGLGLGLSLFSGRGLRRLKVFISTHFYRHRYDYRVEWMRFTRTMSEADPETGLPQRAIQALAQIVGSRGGVLWRLEQDGSRFAAAACWPDAAGRNFTAAAPLVADASLPAYLQRTAWLVDLQELQRRPALYGDLQVDAAALQVDADALIVPLLHVERLYGWIALARAPGREELDFEDRDLLKVAGRQVAAHLAQADAAACLADAHRFETYNRMTAFIMHDLKNVAAQLRLISQNAERHRRNPEFVDDAFRTIASSSARMTKLISQLTGHRDSAGTLQTLDLAACAERAARRCDSAAPAPRVQVLERARVFADLDHLSAIIEHAIRNAQDATDHGGEVRVEIGVRSGRPWLAVVDDGCGMDAQFVRERLFRPFDTTKGARGMGIGAFQMREYVRSLGGDIEVQSEPGKGTRLTMLFDEQPGAAMARMAAEGVSR